MTLEPEGGSHPRRLENKRLQGQNGQNILHALKTLEVNPQDEKTQGQKKKRKIRHHYVSHEE